MKKNVIFLVIDSLLYTRLGKFRNYSPTPFIDELMTTSVFTENMYSQAPFTEAAVISLLSSANTLDNGGYLKRFKNQKKTIGEIFQDRGYNTFHQFQPHIYPSSLKKGFSDIYYSVVFDINSLWNYRLEYFSSLFNENKLSKPDIEDLKEFLEENFNSWVEFLKDLIQNNNSMSLIGRNIKSYDAHSALNCVENEFKKFLNDKDLYIKTLLKDGRANNPLFSIPVPEQKKIFDSNFKTKFINTYKDFFIRSYKANKKFNIRNNRISLNELKNIITVKNIDNNAESNLKQLARYLYNYKKAFLIQTLWIGFL